MVVENGEKEEILERIEEPKNIQQEEEGKKTKKEEEVFWRIAIWENPRVREIELFFFVEGEIILYIFVVLVFF
jgi:hypothetical protein